MPSFFAGGQEEHLRALNVELQEKLVHLQDRHNIAKDENTRRNLRDEIDAASKLFRQRVRDSDDALY